MSTKDIKEEARAKLALNMHQAVLIYTIVYAIFMMFIVIVVLAAATLDVLNKIASIVIIVYGCILLIAAVVCSGILSYSMTDYYLASYRCKPYNIRRLSDTLARNGIGKIFGLNLRRTLIGFLLLLCLIVPGVIYLMKTSMACSLLIANPSMKASTALSASSKIMTGKTGAYFKIMMSLFGWMVLCVLSLGIGFIFFAPYINLCKIVFFKRELQGDKTVYRPIVQPVSPEIAPQAVPNPQDNQFYASAAQQQPIQQGQPFIQPQHEAYAPKSPNEVERPFVTDPNYPPIQPETINPPIQPIEALEEEDVSDLNAVIRDLDMQEGAEPEQVEVPEVPISPMAKMRTAMRNNIDLNAQNNAKNNEKSQPKRSQKVDDPDLVGYDIVETVKPLTTQEVQDSDVLSRKINNLFATDGAQPTKNSSSNFMPTHDDAFVDDFGIDVQPDDSIKDEFSANQNSGFNPDTNNGFAAAQGNNGNNGNFAADRPLTDNSLNDEFMTPLKDDFVSASSSDEFNAEAIEVEIPEEQPISVEPRQAEPFQPRQQYQQPQQSQQPPHQESRLERMRREREERRNADRK